jgi:hypothetical protein
MAVAQNPPNAEWLVAAGYYSDLYQKAREWRNRAIEGARAHAPVVDVVEATKLSAARVKQFPRRMPSDHHGYAVVDPVVDYDRVGSTVDLPRAVADCKDEIQTWDSEDIFYAASPERTSAGRRTIVTDMCDEGTELWTIYHLESTNEIYAHSKTGSIALLGSLPADFVEASIMRPTQAMRGRPGGVVWIHSRIKLIRSILEHDAIEQKEP